MRKKKLCLVYAFSNEMFSSNEPAEIYNKNKLKSLTNLSLVLKIYALI